MNSLQMAQQMDTNGLFAECTTAVGMFPYVSIAAKDVFLHLSDCGQHTPRVGDMVKFTVERWGIENRPMGTRRYMEMISLENNHGRGVSFLVNKLVKMAGNCHVQVQGKSHFFYLFLGSSHILTKF